VTLLAALVVAAGAGWGVVALATADESLLVKAAPATVRGLDEGDAVRVTGTLVRIGPTDPVDQVDERLEAFDGKPTVRASKVQRVSDAGATSGGVTVQALLDDEIEPTGQRVTLVGMVAEVVSFEFFAIEPG